MKEVTAPADTGRDALSRAIAESKRRRGAMLQSVEMQHRAIAYVEQCAQKLEAASAGIITAKDKDASDTVRHLAGAKGSVAGITAVKVARQAEADAQDEYGVAAAAKKRVDDDLVALAEAAALADNAVAVERNRLIGDFIRQTIAEGEELRRKAHVGKCLLTALIAAAGEAPPLDYQNQISEAAKSRLAGERDTAVAAEREAARLFLASGVNDGDRSAGEDAAQRLRAQLTKLLEDPATEILETK